jgi:membrane protease YdiL (CAAX protease family)
MPEDLPRAARLALCIVPLTAQLVAQGVATALLAPPTAAAAKIFSPAFGLTALAGYLGLLLGTRWVARVLRADCGLAWPGRGRVLRLAGVAIAVVTLAGYAIDPLFGGTQAQRKLLDASPFPGGATATVGLVLVIAVLVVIGPLGEEYYFRGLLFTSLGAALPALVIQAALFAALHLIPAAFPVLLIDGLALGWARRRSGSIWPGVLAHSVNNALALALVLLT